MRLCGGTLRCDSGTPKPKALASFCTAVLGFYLGSGCKLFDITALELRTTSCTEEICAHIMTSAVVAERQWGFLAGGCGHSLPRRPVWCLRPACNLPSDSGRLNTRPLGEGSPQNHHPPHHSHVCNRTHLFHKQPGIGGTAQNIAQALRS